MNKSEDIIHTVLTQTKQTYAFYANEFCKNGESFIVTGRHNKVTRPRFKNFSAGQAHNQLQRYCP